jgi:glycerol-3-phosphate dehydrogenase
VIGSRAARLALGSIGRTPAPRRPVALPGAGQPDAIERSLAVAHPELAEDVRVHLARHYGTRSAELLAPARDDRHLLERMHPDGPDIWAQAVYGRDREWAATVDDVVHGRTTVALRGLDDGRVRAEVDRMLRG